MSELLRYGEAKAKKDHTCDLCHFKILRGTKYFFSVGIDLGKAMTWHYHIICILKTHDWDPYDWENIGDDNGNGFRQAYGITQEIIDGGRWEPQTDNPFFLKGDL